MPEVKFCSFFLLVYVGALSFVFLTCWLATLGYHWTLSESVNPGLYRETHAPLARGQLVVFCLGSSLADLGMQRGYLYPVSSLLPSRPCEDGCQPLIKTIVAMAGDTVLLEPDSVWINGKPIPHSATKARDSAGRPLMHLPWGTYELPIGALFVMSTDKPNSWDSRYYGPIPIASVISTAAPVLVWKAKARQ